MAKLVSKRKITLCQLTFICLLKIVVYFDLIWFKRNLWSISMMLVHLLRKDKICSQTFFLLNLTSNVLLFPALCKKKLKIRFRRAFGVRSRVWRTQMLVEIYNIRYRKNFECLPMSHSTTFVVHSWRKRLQWNGAPQALDIFGDDTIIKGARFDSKPSLRCSTESLVRQT